MTEIKTFKNPDLEFNTDAWHSDSWGWQVEDEIFEQGLWDMEVTFTKKVPQIKAGDNVTYALWDNTTTTWLVVAVCRDVIFIDNGNKAWAVPLRDVELIR